MTQIGRQPDHLARRVVARAIPPDHRAHREGVTQVVDTRSPAMSLIPLVGSQPDPLAGLRNEQTERFDADDDEGVPAPAEDNEFGGAGSENGWAEDRPTLDLSGDMAERSGRGQDEFALGGSQGASDSPLATKPGRKRPLTPGEGADGDGSGEGSGHGGGGGQGGTGGSASLPGNTLFERMANLSRGSQPTDADEDDEDDDDGGSGGGLNIPRFLGRQNNQ